MQPGEDGPEPALDVRFGPVGLVQVRIRRLDPDDVFAELTARMLSAPRFFDHTAVAADLSALDELPPADAVRGVIAAIRRTGLMPIGLAHATQSAEAIARELGLPVLAPFRAGTKHSRAVAKPTEPAPPAPAAPPASALPPAARSVPIPDRKATLDGGTPAKSAGSPSPSVMQVQTVRSGQRVYARGRDLVVTAPVASGAEVVADGCVHVYGPLRGRAMAGAHGDATARVFAQEFRAELVSIAGIYRIFETIPPELAGQPVQAWLEGDRLRFGRIGG